jgi:hypothetical protein
VNNKTDKKQHKKVKNHKESSYFAVFAGEGAKRIKKEGKKKSYKN